MAAARVVPSGEKAIRLTVPPPPTVTSATRDRRRCRSCATRSKGPSRLPEVSPGDRVRPEHDHAPGAAQGDGTAVRGVGRGEPVIIPDVQCVDARSSALLERSRHPRGSPATPRGGGRRRSRDSARPERMPATRPRRPRCSTVIAPASDPSRRPTGSQTTTTGRPVASARSRPSRAECQVHRSTGNGGGRPLAARSTQGSRHVTSGRRRRRRASRHRGSSREPGPDRRERPIGSWSVASFDHMQDGLMPLARVRRGPRGGCAGGRNTRRLPATAGPTRRA